MKNYWWGDNTIKNKNVLCKVKESLQQQERRWDGIQINQ